METLLQTLVFRAVWVIISMEEGMLVSPAAKMPVFSAQVQLHVCDVTVVTSFQARPVQAARPQSLPAANAATQLYVTNAIQHIFSTPRISARSAQLLWTSAKYVSLPPTAQSAQAVTFHLRGRAPVARR